MANKTHLPAGNVTREEIIFSIRAWGEMSKAGDKIETLCGKKVSVMSIDRDCPTCDDCKDQWIDDLEF